MTWDSKVHWKTFSTSCANTYHDVTTFGIDAMVENMKNGISQEWIMIFPWDEKIFKLYLEGYIFRSYYLLGELTFYCATYLFLVVCSMKEKFSNDLFI